MDARAGKFFISIMLATVLAMGSLTWSSTENSEVANTVTAQTDGNAQTLPARPQEAAFQSDVTPPNETNGANATNDAQLSDFDKGYRAGYQDGQQDCTASYAAARTSATRTRSGTRARSAPRSRVAGQTYYAQPRRDHSTRDLILTIAAPAAIGAGVGGIASGKKGAGIGALLGGGGGALYYLVKSKKRRR